MLRIQVIDDTCVDEHYEYNQIPLDTPWSDIQTMVRMLHPTCTSCTIEVVEE